MAKNVLVKDAAVIETKVRALGDELAIVLPKEILAQLKLAENQKVLLVATENGYIITVQDEQTEEALEVAQNILNRYENAFKELAK
jgi:antitoxin component of MazEF toxin-antitoxin module